MKLVFSILVLTLGASLPARADAQPHAPVDVCNYIASYNSSSGVDCAKILATGGFFDSNATEFCYDVAQNSIPTGEACLAAIVNNHFQAEAVDVCTYINSYSATSGEQCISAVANKAFLNGTAGLCKTIAQNSISSGLSCLQQSGVDAGKVCPSLKEVSSALDAALNAIYGGTPRVAVTLIQGLQAKITPCLQ